MNCYTLNSEHEELECRKIIIQSIENALKKGDEVFDKFTRQSIENDANLNYRKFKEELRIINHENLKK